MRVEADAVAIHHSSASAVRVDERLMPPNCLAHASSVAGRVVDAGRGRLGCTLQAGEVSDITDAVAYEAIAAHLTAVEQVASTAASSVQPATIDA